MRYTKNWILLSFGTMAAVAANAQMKYPVTKKIAHEDTYFGTVVQDPYQWLENDTATDTEAWVTAQNQVTQEYLSMIPYRTRLKERLTQLSNFEKYASFMKAGKYIIYKKNDGLQNQSVWYYKEGLTGKPLVLLDPNAADPAGTTTFNFLDYSDEHNLIAVSVNKAGSDWTEIRVMDLTTGKFLEDRLEWVKFSDVQWMGNGFFYGRYPVPKQGKEFSAATEDKRIYYHPIGKPQEKDVLIYADPANPRHFHDVVNFTDDHYQVLYKSSGTDGYETLYRGLTDNPQEVSKFRHLFSGFGSKNMVIGVADGRFLVYTNVDAPNYRVVSIDPDHLEKSNWKEIIPASESVLENVALAKGTLVASYLKDARSEIVLTDLRGGNRRIMPLPGLGTVELTYSKPKDEEFFFSFTSFTQPLTNYSYNINTGKTVQLDRSGLTFNPKDYQSEQVWFTSKDGTKVPMFLIHKKDIVLNGSNPAYLYGYGGFNINITPVFNSTYIALLEQGVVIAIANLRGGGEFGESWHQAGMLMKKQNVFDDFISAGEFLIRNQYTSSDKLAIAGGSNGGLLVGACMTQRPDLFRVAFPAVGVMDMLKFQDFTVGWGWVPEYGSSAQSKKMFEYLLGYSPYHNLRKGVDYPATMVTTADHDDRVVPAHSFKFAARLQEYTANKKPALIRIDVQAGHGAGKPISKVIDEAADKWSFFLWNVGVKSLR